MASASIGDVVKKERARLWHGSLISNNNVVKSGLKISMTERARSAACAAAPPNFAAVGIHKRTEHLSLLLTIDTGHMHLSINC
jgi:hypothetical protein